jgi:hypothetical protein
MVADGTRISGVVAATAAAVCDNGDDDDGVADDVDDTVIANIFGLSPFGGMGMEANAARKPSSFTIAHWSPSSIHYTSIST